VLAKEGVRVPMTDRFGVAGTRLLDQLQLGRAYEVRIASLRSLIGAYNQEITTLQREVATALAGDVGYLAIQAIPGVGPVLAAVLWPRSATCIASLARPSCAPGLGSRLLTASPTPLCAVAPSPTRVPGWSAGLPSRPPSDCPGQASRLPTSTASLTGAAPAVGRVAAARRLLTLVFYGLRDGEVRCLAPATAEAG
jgi:hypothetical protein